MFSVLEVARVFVVLDISLFFCSSGLLVVFMVVFARFFRFTKSCVCDFVFAKEVVELHF